MDIRNHSSADESWAGMESLCQFYKKVSDCKRTTWGRKRRGFVVLERFGVLFPALNLHKASHQIMEEYKGDFPNTFAGLQNLKGVGKYTAAAIASISYGERVPAIDGNFYRVFSRILADDFDIASPRAYSYFYDLILPFVDKNRPGDFNQAVMDIGSQVCKPKNPDCLNCPVNEECLAYATNRIQELPVKSKK